MTKTRLAELRKLLVTLATGGATVVSLGVLHGAVLTVVIVALAVLASVGVYATPNADPHPPAVYTPADVAAQAEGGYASVDGVGFVLAVLIVLVFLKVFGVI